METHKSPANIDLMMSSSKQKLQRSFSTPSSSSSSSGLDCDLKLRGKSVGVTPELKYSKSLQEDSPSAGEAQLSKSFNLFLDVFLGNFPGKYLPSNFPGKCQSGRFIVPLGF